MKTKKRTGYRLSPSVVALPISYARSSAGKYFVGQSEPMTFGSGQNAWASLTNPPDSGRTLYVNVFTVTNYAAVPFTAEVILNGVVLGPVQTSTLVSTTNYRIQPRPTPRILLQYYGGTAEHPYSGVNVFDRLVPAGSTLVAEEDGKYIMPPGTTFLLYMTPLAGSTGTIRAIAAFGWWEEPVSLTASSQRKKSRSK